MGSVMRIGSRRSDLALAQARLFIERCRAVSGEDIRYEIVEMSTAGDRIQDRPLYEFAGKGMFVSAFERALEEGEIDAAVHSGKDMPLDCPGGLTVGAVLPRGNPADVLVTLRGTRLTEASVIATGSLRRREQVRRLFGYKTKGIRGNVLTRLEKLKAGEADGLILAAAGLERLSLLPTVPERPSLGPTGHLSMAGEPGQHSLLSAVPGAGNAGDRSTPGGSGAAPAAGSGGAFRFETLDTEKFLPAAAQGIIAVQCRRDSAFAELFRQVNDGDTMRCFLAERVFLAEMGAGCEQPIAAYCRCRDGRIRMDAAYWQDGRMLRFFGTGKAEEGRTLAAELAGKIRAAAEKETR